MSRKDNVARNFLYGAGAQIVTIFIGFIGRTVFIKLLGQNYLGISGLFTSILSVLSLAELGLGNVIVYSLYKPVASNDIDKIRTLTMFYKKIYYGISLAVLIIGLSIAPFLKLLIKLDDNIAHLTFYYVLYVINSSISYLYVYKTSILRADQKQFIISYTNTLSYALCNVVQIISLILTKNFALYLLIQIFFTFFQNFWASKKTEKIYPYLKMKRNAVPIEKQTVKEIVSNTVSMAAYKIGGVILNSTDNMFISAMVNTVTVGYYSNYIMVESVLRKIVTVVQEAINSSLGNYNATSNTIQQYDMFKIISSLFMWMSSYFSIGFYIVSSDVITLWVGDMYILDRATIFAISLNLYLTCTLYPIWIFRNTTGVFRETRNILLYTGVFNIILSFVLGKYYGVFGILIATSIARLLTSFWYEPYVLYKKIFGKRSSWFFKEVVINVTLSVVCVAIINRIISMYLVKTSVNVVIFKILICTLITNLILGIYYIRKKNIRKFINVVLKDIIVKCKKIKHR
jgi:O-antigen/teichoic acid export membrane protein